MTFRIEIFQYAVPGVLFKFQ